MKKRRCRAPRLLKRNFSAAASQHVACDAAEDGHVGAAKFVNGLFAISDDEQTSTPSRCVTHEELDELGLYGVGVLKFVDEDGGKSLLCCAPDCRMIAQQVSREHQQIGKIDAPHPLFL